MSSKALGLTLVLVASAFVMSGCVATDDTANGKGSDGEPNVVPTYDDATGAIAGIVLNSDELPVGGADVGLREDATFVTKTNRDGQFAISNIPPGEYTLLAQALGYEAAEKKVTVTAGLVLEDVLVKLVELPSQGPYSKVDVQRVTISGIMWKLTPECIYTSINPLVKTCGGVRTDCSGGVCEFHTEDLKDFTNEWMTIVGEVTWRPQSGVSGKGFSYDINAPNITRGSGGSINQADSKTWVKATHQAPIAIRIDKPATLVEREIPESDWNNQDPDNSTCTTGSNCDWFWRIFPAACDLGICPGGFGPDYGIMIDSAVEIYFSYFIKEAAPPEYTALPTA